MSFEPLLTRHEGELVVLEPLGPEHREGLAAAAADPEVWRWLNTVSHEPEAFRRWFDDDPRRGGSRPLGAVRDPAPGHR